MEKVPVLFLVFNRLENTKKVFSQIKLYKPEKLFIAADGPRESKDYEKTVCQDVRKYILKNIDWDCEIYTLFRDANLGCGIAVSQAIDWFFEHVDEGVILEDDCFPDISFFTFSQQMLDFYRDDEKVFHISGTNYLPKDLIKNETYYFSKYAFVWGWATWKSKWRKYDYSLSKIKDYDVIGQIFDDYNQLIYWKDRFLNTKELIYNTWDYQWLFSIWNENGICIVPSKNLVINIGFGMDATHTINLDSISSRLVLENISKKIMRIRGNKLNNVFDDFTFYRLYKEQDFQSISELKKNVIVYKETFLQKISSDRFSFRDKIYIIRTYLKSFIFKS